MDGEMCETQKLAEFYLCINALLLIIGLLYLVLAKFAAFQFIFAGTLLVTVILLFFVIGLIWAVAKLAYEKWEMDIFRKSRCNLLDGLAGIATSSISMKFVLTFWAEKLDAKFLYITITYLFIPMILIETFIRPLKGYCRLEPSKHFNHFIVAFIILTIPTIRSALHNFGGKEEFHPAIFGISKLILEVAIDVLIAKSCLEFVQVWQGDIMWLPAAHVNVNSTVPAEPAAATTEAVAPTKKIIKITCKICVLEYSQSRIPRILKECGHTICEECVDKMLKNNKGKLLYCPLCQDVTVVNGPASRLPKNYEVLDVIDEIKKDV